MRPDRVPERRFREDDMQVHVEDGVRLSYSMDELPPVRYEARAEHNL